MNKMLYFIIALFLLTSSTTSAEWMPINNGIPPAAVNFVTYISDSYYINSEMQVFYSTDNGLVWHTRYTSLFTGRDKIYSNNSERLYKSSYQGFYYSDDLGLNWILKNNGIIDERLEALCFNGKKIYAVGMYGTVYLTQDEGETWVSIEDTLSFDKGVSGICIDSFLFVGTTKAIYRTSDDGKSWKNLSEQYGDHQPAYLLYVNKGFLYTWFYSDTLQTLYYTSDYGESWNKSKSSFRSAYSQSLIEYQGKLLAGLFGDNADSKGIIITTDRGDSWQKLATFPSIKVNYLSTNGQSIVAGTEIGIYNSTDGGITWSDRSKDLPHYFPRCFLSIGDSLLSGTNNGIFISDKVGSFWSNRSGVMGTVNIDIRSLIEFNDKIIASTTKGLFITGKDSLNWSFLNSQSFFSISSKDSILFGVNSKGVYKSSDIGKNWILKDSIIGMRYTYSLANNDSCIFVGPMSSGLPSKPLVFRSTDNGDSWELKNIGLPENNIWSLKFIDNVLYAGTTESLFSSSDYGETWIDKSKGLQKATVRCIIKKYQYYFLPTSRGFYISFDDCESWFAYNAGLNSIAISSIITNDSTIIIGTAIGHYKTTIRDIVNNVSVENKIEFRNYLYFFPPFPIPAKTEVRANIYWDMSLDIDKDELGVYDIYGMKIGSREDVRIEKTNGYSGYLVWNCSSAPDGIYFVRLRHGDRTQSLKVMVGR